MSNYENLPGVNIHVKDEHLLMVQDNTSNSILIIDKVNAPESIELLDDVMLVQNEDTLFKYFGQYHYRGQLNPIAAEWYVAKNAGVRNIYLLGLKGTNERENFARLNDMLNNVVADYEFSHIVLSGMYADIDIEGIEIDDLNGPNRNYSSLSEVDGVQVYHTKRGVSPVEGIELSEENPSEVLSFKYKGLDVSATITETISNPRVFVEKLTDKFRMGLSELGISDDDFEISIELDEEKVVVRTTEEVEFEGAAILGALSLEAAESVEEAVASPAQLMADFAERQTAESEATIVYLPTTPPKTTNKSDIREAVDRLVNKNNEYSKHVQVVFGPQVGVTLPGSLRTQWLSGVTQYAVLINSLAVQNAPTNQPLPGVNRLKYDLSLRQLNELTGKKYVTFRMKNNRIVVVDGVTTAPDKYEGQDVLPSDFTRLTTLRSTNYLVSAIRDAVDPFIGKPNDFVTYNAMNTAIKSMINRAIELGIIQDAAYSIELGNSMDAAKINLTVLPQFELRKVNVTIGLTTPAGFEALSE